MLNTVFDRVLPGQVVSLHILRQSFIIVSTSHHIPLYSDHHHFSRLEVVVIAKCRILSSVNVVRCRRCLFCIFNIPMLHIPSKEK